MNQHAVSALAQLEACHLAHRNLTIGNRHTRLDRAAAWRTERQWQADLWPCYLRCLGQGDEIALWPTVLGCWLHFQVLPTYQGVQVFSAHQAQGRLDHPELRTGTGNAIRRFGNARP